MWRGMAIEATLSCQQDGGRVLEWESSKNWYKVPTCNQHRRTNECEQGRGLKLNQCGIVLKDLGQGPSLAGPQFKPISDFFFQSLHGRG